MFRPRVMYTIPTGQNPTGSVSLESLCLRVHAKTLPLPDHEYRTKERDIRYLRRIWFVTMI